MYIPSLFKEEDSGKIHALIRENPFALLISQGTHGVVTSHLPLLLKHRAKQKFLIGHMAKANPQWKCFAPDKEVLVVFSGPHSYISPAWYTQPQQQVPTWNYESVLCHGHAALSDEQGLQQCMQDMVEAFEPENAWSMETLEPSRYASLKKAIVAFEIKLIRMECKRKLSQNKPPEERLRLIQGLTSRGDYHSAKVAEQMGISLAEMN